MEKLKYFNLYNDTFHAYSPFSYAERKRHNPIILPENKGLGVMFTLKRE
jgi:hypothetical protein